jgi:hypothetical protein
MRALSDQFMNDLHHPEGVLHPLYTRVKKDKTLMLAIREKSVNIYYRGGNLLRVTEQTKNKYLAEFDTNYSSSKLELPVLPGTLKSPADTNQWVDAFPLFKQVMDFYFTAHTKAEREFQQLVARENNDSTISNESEYFISDIEFADPALRARFDLLAIRWLANQRKKGSNCRPAFIEMKYADGALAGTAGVVKHLKDMDALITDRPRYTSLLQTMESQFNQLDQLGLLNFNKGSSNAVVKLNPDDRPEVIFMLANHNPRSTKLKTILSDPAIDQYEQSGNFDLRFYVASFAGYGLHASSMLTLAEFRKLL